MNLSSHPDLETGSLKRPDVLVLNAFNGALAFGDTPQPSSLVILEFKQPGRDRYKDSEDPVLQVCKYATHEFARNAQLKPSPDGQGYYGWHSGYDVFVEVISYTKMLDDARRRNRAFFEKLGI